MTFLLNQLTFPHFTMVLIILQDQTHFLVDHTVNRIKSLKSNLFSWNIRNSPLFYILWLILCKVFVFKSAIHYFFVTVVGSRGFEKVESALDSKRSDFWVLSWGRWGSFLMDTPRIKTSMFNFVQPLFLDLRWGIHVFLWWNHEFMGMRCNYYYHHRYYIYEWIRA